MIDIAPQQASSNVVRFLGLAFLLLLQFAVVSRSDGQNRTWNVNGDGDYDVNGNWTPGDVPDTAGENAIITSPGATAVTVTVPSAQTIDVGDLTIAASGAANPHRLVVSDDVFYDVHNDIANEGLIEINGATRNTLLRLETSDLSVTGGGTIRLSHDDFSAITALSNLLLTNGAGHTIEGNGKLGSNTTRVLNQGLIDANVNGGTLTVDPRTGGAGVVTFDNEGTAQASNGGTLLLFGASGGEFGGTGTYQALADSEVVMSFGAVFRSTTFDTVGTGVVRALAGNNLEWHDVTSNGTTLVDANTDLRMHETITNAGTISLPTSGSAGDIELGTDVMLTGGGDLQFTGAASRLNAIGDFALTNVNNTIQGTGNIGGNTARLVNQSLIDANVSAATLTIDPRTGGAGVVTVDNQDIMQASNGGILELSGNAGGEFGGSGTYQALAGSEVVLNASAIARNTTFTTADDGLVRTGGSQNIEFHDVTNSGNLQITNNSDLRMHGTITNSGTITALSTGSAADFELGSDVQLTGGGRVTLAGPIGQINSIGNFTLNNLNNTIDGVGNVGGNQTRFINHGVVHANVASGTLSIDPRSGGLGVVTFQNQNIVQASSGGTLVLSGNAGGEFGGVGIYRALAGSELVLTAGAVARSTTFDTSNDGLVRTGISDNIEFHNVTNNGSLQISNNTDLRMHGTITNAGEIVLASTGNNTDFELGGNVQLTGNGTVTLTGSSANVTSIGDFTLTNLNNALEGVGGIGANLARVVNHGVVHANVNGGVLTLDPRSGGAGVVTFQNDNVAQSSVGGVLQLSGSAGGEFGGSGVYRALAGSEVVLVSGAIVRDATLNTLGDGLVRTGVNENIELHNVTNDGVLQVSNNTDLRVHGTITNTNTINIVSTGNFSDLELGSDVTLKGGGTINLQGPAARFTTIGSSLTITNMDNTIQGAGDINANVVSNGSIVGTSASEFIEINNRLSGDGALENVRIDSIHAPGNSTAVVPLTGEYTIANTGELHVEVGGLAPGAGYDQLSSTGTVNLAGDLVVTFADLGNGYIPSPGDQFEVVTSNSPINGTFDTVTFAESGGGLALTWLPVDYSDPLSVVLEIATTDFFAADFEEDGDVDNVDLTFWQTGYGINGTATHTDGDANGNLIVDGTDFLIWQRQRGLGAPQTAAQTIPEPTAMLLTMWGLVLAGNVRRRA